MENVLDLYSQPFNEKTPLICLDEKPYQVLAEAIKSIPAKEGQLKRVDYTYKRLGVKNIFMSVCPKSGWRNVKLTDRRTSIDYAGYLKNLVDVHFPNATKIIVVQDNLNTHSGASLYKAFTPEEARRILLNFILLQNMQVGSIWLKLSYQF